MEYARLALDNEMQAWVDAEDCLDVWSINREKFGRIKDEYVVELPIW